MQSNDGLMSSSLQHKSVGKRKTHSQTAPVYLHFSRVAGEDWVQFMQSSSELLTDGWGRQRYIFLIYCWCPQMFLQACLYENVNIATTVISLTAVQVNHILSVFEDQPPKEETFLKIKASSGFILFFWIQSCFVHYGGSVLPVLPGWSYVENHVRTPASVH